QLDGEVPGRTRRRRSHPVARGARRRAVRRLGRARRRGVVRLHAQDARPRRPRAPGAGTRARLARRRDSLGPRGCDMAEEDLKAELERLKAENEKLNSQRSRRVSLKVSEKGGVSVYGLGRFPVTLYKEQWAKLLAMADEIREFIKENEGSLKAKPGSYPTARRGARRASQNPVAASPISTASANHAWPKYSDELSNVTGT